MSDQELFQEIADDLGGRGMARGVILDDQNQVLYSTRDMYFSPNLFNKSANERYLNDIHRLIQMAEPMREEPLEPLAFELGGDIYELHVEDEDIKHLYGVCENPMYHVYAHLQGPFKFIVFSMVHMKCPDPMTSYPALHDSVNRVAASINGTPSDGSSSPASSTE